MASLQLVAGKLGDRVGRRRIMLGGLAYFGISSLGAAMASSLPLRRESGKAIGRKATHPPLRRNVRESRLHTCSDPSSLSLQNVMPKFSAFLPTPETSGDFEEMCMAVGESAGLVKEIKPAGEIVHEMIDEARRIIAERLAPMTIET
jgi:hypothetical protein